MKKFILPSLSLLPVQRASHTHKARSRCTLHGGSGRFTNYELNGRYAFTPAWTGSGADTFTDARLNGASPKYNQLTLQTDYALSKRTDVYAEAAYQHVGSTGNPGVTAHIVGVSASSTDTQVVGTVGIRHRF
jgi:GBP family porin